MTDLIVDGSNITMRAIKASQGFGKGLSAKVDDEDVTTSGLLVAINLLSKYIRQVNPSRVAICFDSGSSDYRMSIDANYKRDRSVKDSAVMDTFDLFREFLTVSEIHHVAIPGVEADDIVTGYVYLDLRWRSSDMVILSGDKDFLQLLSANGGSNTVTQLRPGVNPEMWTASTVLAKMGVTPQNLAKVMALTGDKVDGVPGLPRVGEKTAVKILTEFDWNLNASFAHKLVAGHEKRVMRNFDLVNLKNGPWTDIYDDLELPEFEPSYGDGVIEWLNRFDMLSVLGRVKSKTLWTTGTLNLFQGAR